MGLPPRCERNNSLQAVKTLRLLAREFLAMRFCFHCLAAAAEEKSHLPETKSRPNILFIVTDEQGAQMSCLGT